MITFRQSQPPYPTKFQAGDVAISKVDVDFCNGEQHKAGDRIDITEENVAYYNVWHNYYDKV